MVWLTALSVISHIIQVLFYLFIVRKEFRLQLLKFDQIVGRDVSADCLLLYVLVSLTFSGLLLELYYLHNSLGDVLVTSWVPSGD